MEDIKSGDLINLIHESVNEVVMCFDQLNRAHRKAFGEEMVHDIGLVSMNLKLAGYKKGQARQKALSTADYYLQIVKSWVDDSQFIFYVDKEGSRRTALTSRRALACKSKLDELGARIGGLLDGLTVKKEVTDAK